MSKEIHLGTQAKRILEDEIFTDAVKKIEERLNQEWLASPLRDTEAREKIFLMRKMLESLINEITSVMEENWRIRH